MKSVWRDGAREGRPVKLTRRLPSRVGKENKMTTHISNYEAEVKKCFTKAPYLTIWYGGTEGKVGDDPNNMYVAIPEDENWWKNKCVLRNDYFNYELFESLPLELDCVSYGVYVAWVAR